MAHQPTLTALSPREAVADALHRCLLGIDTNDHALFSSACLQDSRMTVTAGPIHLEGWPAIDAFFARLFSLVTTHMTSNMRIEIKEGGDEAEMSAHAMSYHVREEDALKEEDTAYRAANLYDVGLVRGEGGEWRIRRWGIKVLWTTGDRAVLHG
ncbi:hypothetical protein EJ04DRAFT_575529 [Polyplosphaeria fusca]|uniref:SnoaL-like domain-containing protein n=1 Tax=Polyplosphaeria fusca TaxID=682080 RepID=A0A9P4V1C8_9PLEO|nr:hypothetical protein EJ04DRAFT_575529 [Polyplosphaeria fusca]